jgi:hypothetical protein
MWTQIWSEPREVEQKVKACEALSERAHEEVFAIGMEEIKMMNMTLLGILRSNNQGAVSQCSVLYLSRISIIVLTFALLLLSHTTRIGLTTTTLKPGFGKTRIFLSLTGMLIHMSLNVRLMRWQMNKPHNSLSGGDTSTTCWCIQAQRLDHQHGPNTRFLFNGRKDNSGSCRSLNCQWLHIHKFNYESDRCRDRDSFWKDASTPLCFQG